MMLAKLAAAGCLGYAAYLMLAGQGGEVISESGTDTGGDAPGDWLGTAETVLSEGWENIVTKITGKWAAPAEYAPAIAAAEAKYGIPPGMLERQLWQESRYNPAIINGTKRSPAGAIGIAQFMPATAADFGIDPTEPFQSIDAAGKYMSQLYNRFGQWDKALAAYNWGMGNVARKGLGAAPTETRNYFTQILGDLGMLA